MAAEMRHDDYLERSVDAKRPSAATCSIAKEPATQHDYPEDWAHENGEYTCYCPKCLTIFIGHKRRTLCKVCVEQ